MNKLNTQRIIKILPNYGIYSRTKLNYMNQNRKILINGSILGMDLQSVNFANIPKVILKMVIGK